MFKVSFNNKQNPFFTTLKEKVNNHFSDNNIHTSGNKKLYIKSFIQVSAAIAFYIILVFFTPGTFISLLLCMLLGISLAVIGFNVMHEGGHKSFSKYQWLNTTGAYFLNILGGNTFFWKIKHNINHHTYTNIDGMDSDIDMRPFMRLHQNQKRYWIHRYQHFYCTALYAISYFVWVFGDDFAKYFTGKIAAGQTRRMNIKEHLIFWLTKFLYVIFYIVIPTLMVGFGKILLGFAVVCFACGISIAIVFQLAHVVEETTFHKLDEESAKIEQEWAVHQIHTTANFSTKNKAISWLLGGLNFQVEHHLFPRISHVHYPKINEFVRETCEQYEVKYLEHPSFIKAVCSHYSHIKKMGKAVG